MLTCQILSGPFYSVAGKMHFLIWHLVLAPLSGVETKLNVDAQRQTFPYPTILKSLLLVSSNAFCMKFSDTLLFKSTTHRQTKTNIFGSPSSVQSIRLGMVIEDLEHFLALWKRLGVRRIVLPVGGAENFMVPDPLKLKPPYLWNPLSDSPQMLLCAPAESSSQSLQIS